jgi:hypothetical protein
MVSSGDSEKFCLKWNEYENNVSATFKNLRDDQDFADVTLAAEGELQVEVHTIVLAASSPFFSALLRNNKKEDRHPLIYLRGVKAKDLMYVVDFMYNGEVNVYQEDLKEFLVVAEELQLRGLRQEDEDDKADSSSSCKKPLFEDEAEDDAEEIIIDPENNKEIDDHMEDIAEIDESIVQNASRVVVDETDDIEEMIESMMVRLEGDWTCVICGKKAGKYKNNLRKHVEIIHVDQKGRPCKFCSKTFKSRPNLYAHLKRCPSNPEQQIPKLSPAYLSLKNHEESGENGSAEGQMVAIETFDGNMDLELEAKVESMMTRIDGDWTCAACGKNSGKLKANLRKHIEARHIDGLVLACNNCGRTFG